MTVKGTHGPEITLVLSRLGTSCPEDDMRIVVPEGKHLILSSGSPITVVREMAFEPSRLVVGNVATVRPEIVWPPGATYTVPLSQGGQEEIEIVMDLLRKQEPGAREALRALRERRGWTREQFAAIVDVSPQTIYRWEGKGAFPRRRP